ncbi:MAG: hypothetical protein AB2392_08770 [Neobacillus sp.]
MSNSQSGSMVLEAGFDQEKKAGLGYVVFGWTFAFISLLFIPILFGAAGVFMGFKTFQIRSPLHGIIIMFFSTTGVILGSLFSFLVAGTNFI